MGGALFLEETSVTQSMQLECPDDKVMLFILGQNDINLSAVEKHYGVKLVQRGSKIFIQGGEPDDVRKTYRLLAQMRDVALDGHRIDTAELRYAMDTMDADGKADFASMHDDLVCLTFRGKPVRPKTVGQRAYMKAIAENTITFGIGPAGTGKTYLAVCAAVKQLKAGAVSRIILVRPAVEAGESLGYLPGDLREKVEPYLRPLYDAFFDLLSPEKFGRYVEKNVIEIAPLAYMRGRTLNDSFIILDEAQNTTPEQMKMFLTRLGFGSRAIVTGDLTQVDLPNGKKSGLKIIQDILKNIEGISFVYLDKVDVVRHEIVQKVVAAYERYEEHQNLEH